MLAIVARWLTEDFNERIWTMNPSVPQTVESERDISNKFLLIVSYWKLLLSFSVQRFYLHSFISI